MVTQEISPPSLAPATAHVTVTPEALAPSSPVGVQEVNELEDRASPSDLPWDPLLIAVAGYLLTAVGRVHQLFPVLDMIRPATMTGVIAIACYASDRQAVRRFRDVFVGPTKVLAAFLVWTILSVPGALVVGTSFDVVFGNFIKTAVMYVVVAGAIRERRDVERLAMVY